MAMDPVCGMKVDDKNPEFQTEFGDRIYVFCSEQCLRKFEQEPEDYIETAA
jgi:YHS domain-containing protein